MPLQKNAKMIKIHFLYLDKYGSYIKIFTREHFSKFYSVFYTVTHSGFERKNCRGGESLQKEEEREHKDSGKKKKKKVCNCSEWLVQEKGGGDICWWNDF